MMLRDILGAQILNTILRHRLRNYNLMNLNHPFELFPNPTHTPTPSATAIPLSPVPPSISAILASNPVSLSPLSYIGPCLVFPAVARAFAFSPERLALAGGCWCTHGIIPKRHAPRVTCPATTSMRQQFFVPFPQ